MDQIYILKTPNAELQCPACESLAVSESYQVDKFQYGEGVHATKLYATVPLCICDHCKLQYTDERAEKIRHEVVCRHLQILCPEEVYAIRERYRKTQQEFSEITGIGRASLGRWETGKNFQNSSSDNLIFLLGFPENMDRLVSRGKIVQTTIVKIPFSSKSKFRCIDEGEISLYKKDSQSFQLHLGH